MSKKPMPTWLGRLILAAVSALILLLVADILQGFTK